MDTGCSNSYNIYMQSIKYALTFACSLDATPAHPGRAGQGRPGGVGGHVRGLGGGAEEGRHG